MRKISPPHKLDLYRQAVQHPLAEAGFLQRAYGHYHKGKTATLLREDFAGGAAVAATWVALHENNRALAVDRHAPTCRWAQRYAATTLGPRAADLQVVCGDVMSIGPPRTPRVDVIAALNFGVLYCHTRTALRNYFVHCRRNLRPGGLVVIDAYGGPGAMCVGTQRRGVTPDDGPQFEYLWEQASYDAVTARVDCRIHFRLAGGRMLRNAFRYDWRLWTLPELQEAMTEAKFSRARVWCDGRRRGAFEPVKNLPAREAWVAYVVGVR